MKRKILSAVLSLSMAAPVCAGFAAVPVQAAANTPTYQKAERQMEKLGRGLIAVKTTKDTREQTVNGVYLSWRLFGTESLENQAFDIYKNGVKIKTTGAHDATCYTDTAGTAADKYKVVKAGEDASAEPEVTPIPDNYYAKPSEVGSGASLKNSFTYIDIPLERPDDSNGGHYFNSGSNEGGANDASIGDLDGDGDYEIVLKWDPTNSKDAAGGGTTGNTYIDGYEIDPSNNDPSKNANNHLYMWRIDLGPHVRSGAHENPFLVYDFDGDGEAEIASITGPGAIDGTGRYVTEAGDTEEIRNTDNTALNLRKGKNIGPEFYTVFDGKTGRALCTTEAILIGREDGGDWGDSKMNRSSRYLAAVAYLDGVHPSIVMCRGYYNRAALRAYTWDGSEMSLQWEYDAKSAGTDSLYGQGNHNLSVGDIDNDGKDEIVYGSAALDHDGKTVLGNTQLGHGDAMHMSDFNNDGVQEVFSVKEDLYKKSAEDLRVPATGKRFWPDGKLVTTDDNGRGVMDNIDDAYAKEHENARAIGWSSGLANAHDLNGDDLMAKPSKAGSGSFDNFLVYWDGDLSRELLDANIIQKYDASTGYTKRFYGPSDGYTLVGGSTNNYTKRNPSLVADLWGDWREEVIMPTGKGEDESPALRIFTSTMPTEYRLATLMHDSQYRLAIAWQNVGYNQPPHQSYYIGSAALAADANGQELNYLAPAASYTNVTYDAPAKVDVTGISMEQTSIKVERNKTASINASVLPENATKKRLIWTSADSSVAKVSNGTVTGVAPGKTTVTATTAESSFSASCEVEVFSNPVTGISISETSIELGMYNSAKLTAHVTPADASDPTVLWTSENPAVAAVDQDGNVEALSYGKTRIIAATRDGGFRAECTVNVKPINMTDMTGEDKFDFAQPNTDGNTTLDSSAVSAALAHKEASSGTVVQKSFESISENKAVLSFKFTTGASKLDGTNWNWTGHEYSAGLNFLDTEGNSILDISQAWTSKAQNTKSSVMGGENKDIGSDWTMTESNGENPLNRSATRWFVTLEFDYDASECTAKIAGSTSDWVSGITYEKTFALNGKSFKTLQLYTINDGTGTITASPKIEELSYSRATKISGNTADIYNKGAENTAWTEADVNDWTHTGEGVELMVSDGRLWYNPTQPGVEYSAEKKFEGIEAGAYVTYDIDWHFGLSTARDGNTEYLRIGDKLRLAWDNGYLLKLSTDDGASWLDSDNDGTADALFTGANEEYTKNVKAVFNTNNKTVTLYLDNTEVGEYIYSDADGNSADGADTVKFGFTRAGKAAEWNHPNGIDRIRVSQFVEGEELPDPVDAYAGDGKAIIAEYDADGRLVGIKGITDVKAGDPIIEASSASEKVFVWNSLEGMKPVSTTESSTAPSSPNPPAPTSAAPTAPAVTGTPTPTPAPTGTPTPTPLPTGTPTPTPLPTASPTPSPSPAPTASPTPEPTMRAVEYEEVFSTSENFLMKDSAENKWIISSDAATTDVASENTEDISGNATAKLALTDKAVQCVLDEAISSKAVRLTYDMLIDKTSAAAYGRYFRIYFDNTAHPFDAAAGKATDYGNTGAFFHMMDYYDTIYTTNSETYIAATQSNTFPSSDAVQLSETAVEGGAWYRVVIENDLMGNLVSVKYYRHSGDGTYNAELDAAAAEPVISAIGCNTEGRELSLKQIKLMRTSAGILYFDNIKLEREIIAAAE